jgi:glycosyltransferase involved in cell wall biosynthesis
VSTDRPRVAVVIPCFNDGRLALDAVASVQEHEPVEIVVVDDASTDAESREALARVDADTAARLVRHQTNQGLPRTRMTGVGTTSARYVFPLDADDLAIPGALRTMANLLDAHPAAAVCFGDYLEFGDHELIRAVPPSLDPYRLAYTNEYPPSAMFRRRVLDRTGGWQGPYGYEDWDLWMRLAEDGEQSVYAGAGVLTYRRRLHGTRMLTRSRERHVELYRMLRARHPELFANLSEHRRASGMPLARKLLYPVVYGGRRRFAFERAVKATLDRLGVWTLRR